MPHHEIKHPLIAHHIAQLRDENTHCSGFRRIVRRLSFLLAYEATRDLKLTGMNVKTPVGSAKGHELSQRIAVAPILRAGIGMEDALLELIPHAEVYHMGVYRDEVTLEPIEYYRKLPRKNPAEVGFVLDPMLATGGSANAVIGALDQVGVQNIRILSLIASHEGIQRVEKQHPNADIYVCAIDSRLDDHGYILPGLGDAGDRLFNTTPFDQ